MGTRKDKALAAEGVGSQGGQVSLGNQEGDGR